MLSFSITWTTLEFYSKELNPIINLQRYDLYKCTNLSLPMFHVILMHMLIKCIHVRWCYYTRWRTLICNITAKVKERYDLMEKRQLCFLYTTMAAKIAYALDGELTMVNIEQTICEGMSWPWLRIWAIDILLVNGRWVSLCNRREFLLIFRRPLIERCFGKDP